MKKQLLLVFMALCLIFSGCKKEPAEKTKPHVNKIVWAKNTVLISDEDNRFLTYFDDYSLIFSKNDKIDNVKVGDILLSNITTLAPGGYLRKITEILKEGESITLKTEGATLEDAIDECDIRYENKFTDNNIVSVEDLTGKKGDWSFSFETEKEFEFEIEEDVKVSGVIKLEPTLFVSLIIDNSSVKEFTFYIKNKTEIKINGVGFGIDTDEKQLPLCEIRLAPLTIPPCIPVFQKVHLYLEGKAEAKAGYNFGASNIYIDSAGISYKNKQWISIAGRTKSTKNEIGALEGEVNAYAGIFIGYEADFFAGINAIIGISTGGGLKFEGGFKNLNPYWKLYWFIKATAEAEVKFLGWSFAKFEGKLFDEKWLIKQWPEEVFVPVKNIKNVPTKAFIGIPLTLVGTVEPNNATNRTILWDLKSANGTGAWVFDDDQFKATKAGTAKIIATVVDGLEKGKNYVKEFDIEVVKPEEPENRKVKVSLLVPGEIYLFDLTLFITDPDGKVVCSYAGTPNPTCATRTSKVGPDEGYGFHSIMWNGTDYCKAPFGTYQIHITNSYIKNGERVPADYIIEIEAFGREKVTLSGKCPPTWDADEWKHVPHFVTTFSSFGKASLIP